VQQGSQRLERHDKFRKGRAGAAALKSFVGSHEPARALLSECEVEAIVDWMPERQRNLESSIF
jgi:hypothetical protein